MRSSRVWHVLPQPRERWSAAFRRSSTHTKTMFDAMEFGFLFDPTRKLFSIGYRVADNSLDPSCYDLLASEARLTSFIAIAKGDVPSTHWFHLGRALTPVDPGICAGLLVRVDVRVPHAGAGDALVVGQSVRPDVPSHRPPSEKIWSRAWRAVGGLGIGLQRARSGAHLPVLEFWRTGPWAQTRA